MGVQVHKAGRENTIIAVNTLMMISRVRIIVGPIGYRPIPGIFFFSSFFFFFFFSFLAGKR